jgi:beta-phosphoglucomutase-like phosphatase (HAD superfamily)
MHELVIFDCDGVLVDSEVISNEVLARMLTREGLPTTLPRPAGPAKGSCSPTSATKLRRSSADRCRLDGSPNMSMSEPRSSAARSKQCQALLRQYSGSRPPD